MIFLPHNVNNKYPINISHKGGLTPTVKYQIAQTNIENIVREFEIIGIESDFKNNKLVAWASKKCVDLICLINKSMGTIFGLPKGIFVEDFNKLKIGNIDIYGFSNLAPMKLYKNRDDIVPEKTIFFNQFEMHEKLGENIIWDNVDKVSNVLKSIGVSATNSFFEIFMHEFSHVMHENNMINKLGGKLYLQKIQKLLQTESLEIFHNKYQYILSSICIYAAENPMEAIACDLSKRIINNTNLEDLSFEKDFLKRSPYNQNILDIFYNKSTLERILTNFWKGNFQ